jgi:HTH-type transcriptional regulator/antitoxin HigA
MEALKLIKTPGTVVREAMDAKGWNQTDLAYALGTTGAAINQILNNKRSISHNMAKALAVALGEPAEMFARIQAEWDVHIAQDPDPMIGARARILSQYPLRDMIKRGWVDPEHGRGTLEEQICRFFAVSSLDEVPHLNHSAKKTEYSDVPSAQLAWLFRVRQIASEIPLRKYDANKLRETIDVFKTLRADPDQVRLVPQLLNEAGVRFVVVESLSGSAIDGVCFWLNPHAPVVGLSMRFDRIDNFWFVLRHECSHVLHGHGHEQAILDSDLNSDKNVVNDEENIANAEASDFCVPTKDMQSFYQRKRPLFSERDVNAFSIRMKVHPGLVVGQLQRMLDKYDFLRKYLVKVRHSVAMSMMMDGWGDVIPIDR